MPDIIDINTLFGPLPIASADLAPEDLLELLNRHEINTAYTLSTLGLLLDPQVGNASTRAACSENPLLRPVATLDPTLYFGDEANVQKLKTDGFAFVRFFPYSQKWPIEYAPFQALCRVLDSMQMPIMIDVEKIGVISQLSNLLANHASPVILTGVDAHLLAEGLAVWRERKNWFAETSRLLSPGALKLIADSVGVGRLLYGSGAPFTPPASALQALTYAGLSEEAQQDILSGNAARLLARR